MQQGKQSKSQGGKETTKIKKSPPRPLTQRSVVIFLILTFDILSEQTEFLFNTWKSLKVNLYYLQNALMLFSWSKVVYKQVGVNKAVAT